MIWQALGSGLAGALQVTAIHEVARRQIPQAPRMDKLGMESLAKSMEMAGYEPPQGQTLHQAALVGDLLSNSLYYSLVGLGQPDRAWLRGGLLGLAAGIGAVMLPRRLGLDETHSNRTTATQIMTVGWYLAGGLVAGAVYSVLSDDSSQKLNA